MDYDVSGAPWSCSEALPVYPLSLNQLQIQLEGDAGTGLNATPTPPPLPPATQPIPLPPTPLPPSPSHWATDCGEGALPPSTQFLSLGG